MTSFTFATFSWLEAIPQVSLQIRRGSHKDLRTLQLVRVTLGLFSTPRKTRVAPLYPAEGKEQRSCEADGSQGNDGDSTPDTSEAKEPPPPHGHSSPSSSQNPETISEGDKKEEGDSKPQKLTSFSSEAELHPERFMS